MICRDCCDHWQIFLMLFVMLIPKIDFSLFVVFSLCFCAKCKTACDKCLMEKTRTASSKQLSCNLPLLTLHLWLCGCVAVRHVAKRSRTAKNRLGLGAGLG
jgi:hypothetical protein